jgi:L-alanine-DL-glutamate epimerase-like enolase superfamily enzyme
VPTWDLIADLPLEVEGYGLEGLEFSVGPEFTRLTTVIRLRGAGEEGIGEDVTYDALDQIALQDAGATLPLAGSWTLASFCDRLDELDLWLSPPVREVSRNYRRWAFESAALDLALRQAGRTLADALGREPRPLSFVVSCRLGDPSTFEPIARRLERYPSMRFKLDPTNDWTDELIAQLAETGAVDTLDLKGFYKGTPVDVDTDPELYRRVAEAFPAAWIEDPDLSHAEAAAVLEPHRDRLTFDAPLHSLADIEELPFRPKAINVKPSRFGGLRTLLGIYDWCEAQGVAMYGGGQFELGPGRGQIEYLASLFHPDMPNDVAPVGYHAPEPADGLPESPLEPRIAATGFRWDG